MDEHFASFKKRQRGGNVGLLCLALMICQAAQKSLWFWKLTFGPQLSNYLGHHPGVRTVHNDVFWAQGQGLGASENLDWRQEVKTPEGERVDPPGMPGCLKGDSARVLRVNFHLSKHHWAHRYWIQIPSVCPEGPKVTWKNCFLSSLLQSPCVMKQHNAARIGKPRCGRAPSQQDPQASPAVFCSDHPVV